MHVNILGFFSQIIMAKRYNLKSEVEMVPKSEYDAMCYELNQQKLISNRLRVAWNEDVAEARKEREKMQVQRDRLKDLLSRVLQFIDEYSAGGRELQNEIRTTLTKLDKK